MAGLLCIYFPNDNLTAFSCLVNIINSGPFISLLRMKAEELKFLWDPFSAIIRELNPNLYNHFNNIGLEVHTYLLPWLMVIVYIFNSLYSVRHYHWIL